MCIISSSSSLTGTAGTLSILSDVMSSCDIDNADVTRESRTGLGELVTS